MESGTIDKGEHDSSVIYPQVFILDFIFIAEMLVLFFSFY